MDDIRRMLDRLPELSDSELSELESEIVSAFASVEGQEISRESVADMTFLADSVESVRAELSARESEQTELVAQASEAAARVSEAAEGSGGVVGDGGPGEEVNDPAAPPEDFSAEGAETVADSTEVVPENVETVAAAPESAAPETVPVAAAAATEAVAAEVAAPEVVAEVPVPKVAAPEVVAPEVVATEAAVPETVAVAAAIDVLDKKKDIEDEAEDVLDAIGDVKDEVGDVKDGIGDALVQEAIDSAVGDAVDDAIGGPPEGMDVNGLPTDDEVIDALIQGDTLPGPDVIPPAPLNDGVDLGGPGDLGDLIGPGDLGGSPEEETPLEDLAEGGKEEEEDSGNTAGPVFSTNEEKVEVSEGVEAPMGNTAAGPETFSAPADRLPGVRENVDLMPITLVAGGDIPGITAGSALSGSKGLADAMALRLHTLRRASGGSGDQVVVASLIASFPEERTLRGNELDSNSEKIKSITNPNAVVASGGWCAPLAVNYDIFDIGGSTDTPVKDSLPVFTSDRGGVRFIVPPVLDDYVGAVNIWTNQDDINASPPSTSPRKQCLTVKCAAEDEVYLDAITMCMCFGNLMTRAFPELIDRHNQLALVEAARFSEIYILNKIKAESTAVALPAVLGAVRDVLISVERAAVAYRHKHRLDPALPLRFVAPQWLHAMIRSDLTAQLPGDGMETTFNLSNATIDNFFNERNIRPVWTLDGVGNLPVVTDYPDEVEWALYAEGTFTLLDGGTLDIGLVRDMNLVSTNDYCMFTEQFLAVAKTGVDSLWVTQTLNVNGGSAGTLDVASVDY